MASAVSVEGRDEVPEYEWSEQSSPYASEAVGVAGSDAASACELKGGWEPLGKAAPEVGSALPDADGVCAVASAVSVEGQDDVPEYHVPQDWEAPGASEQSVPYASEAAGIAGSDPAVGEGERLWVGEDEGFGVATSKAELAEGVLLDGVPLLDEVSLLDGVPLASWE